jgi:hypothetical protein
MELVPNGHEIRNYFRYPRVGWVIEELGLYEVHFGEYMVEREALTREELFHALSEQDRQPGLRLGEVVAALGFLPYEQVEALLADFEAIAAIVIGEPGAPPTLALVPRST